MEPQRLRYLLDQYHKGLCTPAEEQEINDWYHSIHIDDQQFQNLLNSAGQEKLADDMYNEFKSRTGAKIHSLSSRKWMMRAAAVLTGFCLLSGGYYLFNKSKTISNGVALVTPSNTVENKFITLSDGSKVVLRHGSKLNYPASFSGNKREVELIGEAYFDIHHDDTKPFIIHTGKIKTTVLGTAFDIAAYPSQKKVVVTVTRGRVKVENDHKNAVILTPNEQVVYDNQTNAGQKNKVEATRTLTWASSDMVFDGVSFKSIAGLLSRRYQVSIDFKNPDLENCPITASFNGTESLKDILEILCTARGTTYKFENEQKVTIDGNGCN
ncbi:FecR family protein [Mucilaginibacter sp. BT774]|uniref:FecR family protein n=1 Tax=Mucilaginibacter sp. BT774 TaxID=3062276 RepID=UPI0026769D2C|nr:FecR family protein [Mucilaginibacter sp. BT774]MDO3627766.1 FecR family protein [Mucilaginibacter sp. BT774]